MYIQGKIRNNVNVYLWIKTKVHPWNGISDSDSISWFQTIINDLDDLWILIIKCFVRKAGYRTMCVCVHTWVEIYIHIYTWTHIRGRPTKIVFSFLTVFTMNRFL